MTNSQKKKEAWCIAFGHTPFKQAPKHSGHYLCKICGEIVYINILVESFRITSKPKIKYSDIKTRRFNIIDRAKSKI